MAKKTHKEKLPEEKKEFIIMDAEIKDDFCNYSYEVSTGIGIGDTHKVKGSGIVEQDMISAFVRLNVHLAAIDDAFKDVEVKNIDKFHSHELAQLYHVTGFKIKGGEENEQIVLVGSKHINAGGRIGLETPKILLEVGTSYTWYNELKKESDNCRHEVALYKGGKCTAVEKEEQEDPAQLSIINAEEE